MFKLYKPIVFILFSCVSIICHGKNNYSDTVYFLQTGEVVKRKYSDYYRIPVRIDNNNINYYYTEYYYMSDSPMYKGSFIFSNDIHKRNKPSLSDTLHGHGIGFYQHKVVKGEYNRGRKTGTWRYYENGKLSMIEEYTNNGLESYNTYFNTDSNVIMEGSYYHYNDKAIYRFGTWLYYSRTGKINRALDFRNGKLNGYSTYYDSVLSSKIAEGNFLNDKKDGYWKYYNPVTNETQSIESYQNGLLHGPYVVFGKNKKTKYSGFYEYGKPIDTCRVYYSDSDSLSGIINYNKTKGYAVYFDSVSRKKVLEGSINEYGRSGKWKRYHAGTEKLNREEPYKNNMLDGYMVEYDMEGKVNAVSNYFQGRKEGQFLVYHPGTELKWLELYFSDDTIDGEQKTYYMNGRLKRRENYKYGKLIAGICFDEQGEEIPYFPIKTLPEFEGDVMTYIGANLKYPPEAIDAKIEGKVIIGFSVNIYGRVEDVTIIQSLDPQCDQEAIRLIKEMPQWKPAQIDGIPIKMYQTLPIVFWIH
ncbi:MAG: TonB family protein [Flavipsychrobacter sp.]|nr:TonB family protein [Flavipsychrobacter sp.]